MNQAFNRDRKRSAPPSEAEAKLNYIINQISAYRTKYFILHKVYRSLAFLLQFFILVLSAGVTVILGLNLDPPKIYNNIALSLSAVTGVLTALDSFFDLGPFSIKCREAADKFELLKLKGSFLKTGNPDITVESVEELKNECEAILLQLSSVHKEEKTEEEGKEIKDTLKN